MPEKKKAKAKKAAAKKASKKQRGPQYCDSLLKTKVLNYSEYYFSKREAALYSIGAFVVAAAVAYLMYGGIGCDHDGRPTMLTYILNVIICGGAGILGVKLFLPIRRTQLCESRKRTVRQQFMDMLDSLAGSIAAGNNAPKAFEISENDLAMQYGKDAYIVNEVRIILRGQENFIKTEDMLADLGRRSGISEIENFAQVFAVSYPRGGDFGRVIRDTYDILYNKMEIEREIETKIAATKNEFNIMLVMPLVIMGMLRSSGGDFAANFGTVTGVAGVTAGLALVGVSFFIARKITDIKV